MIIPLWLKIGAPIAGLLAVALAFHFWLNGVKHEAKQDGIVQERSGALIETVNKMENASAIRRKIADPASSARFNECLRSARTAENCKRFLPQ